MATKKAIETVSLSPGSRGAVVWLDMVKYFLSVFMTAEAVGRVGSRTFFGMAWALRKDPAEVRCFACLSLRFVLVSALEFIVISNFLRVPQRITSTFGKFWSFS